MSFFAERRFQILLTLGSLGLISLFFGWQRPGEFESPSLEAPQAVTAARGPAKSDPAPRGDESLIDVSGSRANQESPILREVGDKVSYQGYTIIKIDPDEGEENPEVALVRDRWLAESRQFMLGHLGLDPALVDRYGHESQEAFAIYDKKMTAVLESARRIFGPDIAVILEGDLQSLYDESWNAHDRAALEILGERGFEDFEGFKERFYSLAHDRLGFVPNFSR
jgi:hypothetical protein